MLKVGLTGGIACGKTTVGEMFVKLGAHLIQADQIARELMSPGQPIYDDVVRHFGEGILNSDRTIMRARLAELTFGAANQPFGPRIAELNRIVHPEVIRRQEKWMEEIGRGFPRAVAIVEAALILEAGFSRGFDRLIVVTCKESQRVERFAQRQGVSLEASELEVRRRMAAQLPDGEKIKAADFVIDNSGTLEHTERQVREIWNNLAQLN
jgi:dephospho-CoA kinase